MFQGVNISQMAVEKPSLQKFNKHYEKGVIQPKPVKLFEATDIVGTFRYMRKGQHIGKIVVSLPADASQLQVVRKPQTASSRQVVRIC